MRAAIMKMMGWLACLLALSLPLVLVPMFVADARPGAAPTDAHVIRESLTRHAAKYVMRAYSRLPLQYASELHGA